MRNRYGDSDKVCTRCNLESHSYRGFIPDKDENITFTRFNGFRRVIPLIHMGLTLDQIKEHPESSEFLTNDWGFNKYNTIKYILSIQDINIKNEIIKRGCEAEDRTNRIFR